MVAKDDVLGHGERRNEPEVLVHHADPRVERVARGVEMHELAVELDLPLVRAVEAREDVRERRLAGAVLSEQRVHLAGAGLERHIVVRDDAREPLADSDHADGRRRRGAGRAGASISHVTERGSFPHRAQPGGWTEETFPITPLTSHCIEYRSGSTFRVLPFGTISLPFWS